MRDISIYLGNFKVELLNISFVYLIIILTKRATLLGNCPPITNTALYSQSILTFNFTGFETFKSFKSATIVKISSTK